MTRFAFNVRLTNVQNLKPVAGCISCGMKCVQVIVHRNLEDRSGSLTTGNDVVCKEERPDPEPTRTFSLFESRFLYHRKTVAE